MRTISQAYLEELVLGALQNNLMDQDLLEDFCKEYTNERNRLAAEADQGRESLEKELTTVTRDHAKLVDAIVAGIPVDQVKDKMQQLSDRRKALEADLSRAADLDPLRFHPRMADTYRERVQALITDLGKSHELQTAQEALRGLVERIVLHPSTESGNLDIMLEGALSGLLTLAVGSKNAKGLTVEGQAFDNIGELVLVAGVGFEPTTFRL